MATPLIINLDHRDGGTLAVVASGEIDLSNIEAFTTNGFLSVRLF